MKKITRTLAFMALLLLGLLIVVTSCNKDEDNNSNNGNTPTNTPPTASFTVTPESGNTETNFLFDASGCTDNEDPASVLQVRWDWENDGIWDTDWSADKDVNHVFQQEGNYNVSLEVKDTYGLSDATSNSVLVTSSGGNAPVADFSGIPTSGDAPLTVSFTDMSSNNPVSWEWDFGDGNSSTDQNPTHIYANAGTYSVSLSVINTYGSDSKDKQNYIIVNAGGGGTGEPCPGTPTVNYEGQVYNTVYIGSQCWLKENLNVGTRIDGSEEMTDNGVIEKYCYDDNPANCATYGGLYQWHEMMQYTTLQGTQGICPPGWHIPTDEEWKVLEGTVDSQYGVGDPEWDDIVFRGFDAGKNLKTSSGWSQNGNGEDLYSFSGLPGGTRYGSSAFEYVGNSGTWWTSTESSLSEAWHRGLMYNFQEVYRSSTYLKVTGFSVRCLRDY